MDHNSSLPVRVLGFTLDLLNQGASYLMRYPLSRFKIVKVSLQPKLEGFIPSLVLTVEGINPLPIDIRVLSYEMQLGFIGLPLKMNIASQQEIIIGPGKFTFSIDSSEIKKDFNLATITMPRTGKNLTYQGHIVVAIGPLQKKIAVSNTTQEK